MRVWLVVPLADLRTVATEKLGLRSRPAWPLAVARNASAPGTAEFLPFFGELTDAEGGDSDHWVGRRQFVRSSPVRFRFQKDDLPPCTSSLTVEHRRLFGSAVAPRSFLELRLFCRLNSVCRLELGDLRALASLPLSVRVGMPHGQKRIPFHSIGPHLAEAYWRTTTITAYSKERNLVRPGRPLMVVSSERIETIEGASVPADCGRDSGFSHLRVLGVDTWLLDPKRLQHPRQAAMAIVRTHVERNALAAVAAGAIGRSTDLQFHDRAVWEFLRRAEEFLRRDSAYGVSRDVLDVVRADTQLHGVDWEAIREALISACPSIDAAGPVAISGLKEAFHPILVGTYNEYNATIQGGFMSISGDTFYNRDSQIIQQGSGNTASEIVMAKGTSTPSDERLLTELNAVFMRMKEAAITASEFEEVAATKRAIEALEKKDRADAIENIRSIAGKVLKFAEEVGAKVLAKLIESEMGL